jgi:hypothetical protein
MKLNYGELVFGPERFTLDVCAVRLSFGVQKNVCVYLNCTGMSRPRLPSCNGESPTSLCSHGIRYVNTSVVLTPMKWLVLRRAYEVRCSAVM